MRSWLRQNSLRGMKAAGVFDRIRESRWRKQRLLIICYHCFALEEENRWRPALFLTGDRLRERLEMLREMEYNVLPLGDGLARLRQNSLPPRSVALTFDDGTHDFYRVAYPLLAKYRFPATVYQTTHYLDRPMPVYNLICSYMLWKKRDSVMPATPSLGIHQDTKLDTAAARDAVLAQIVSYANSKDLNTDQKNDLAAEVAAALDVDYQGLIRKRVLQLMTSKEISEIAGNQISFELHTHRHRTPRDRALFTKELRDNRAHLEAITKTPTSHFCYPSGDYDRVFLPWLHENAVVSATTGEPGLASRASEPLLLPRFMDTTRRTPLEFEAWLTGVNSLLSARAGRLWLGKLIPS